MNDFFPSADDAEVKIWGATFSASSHIRMWEDDDAGVMYDARTGDTHFLDPIAMELLRLLSQSPLSPRQIVDAFAADLPSGPGNTFVSNADAMSGKIADALQRLQSCGLAGGIPA